MKILIIDAQFDNAPDIETAEAGPDAEFMVVRGNDDVPEQAIRTAEAVIHCRSRRALPASVIDRMDVARIVVQAGVGFNHIDILACSRRGIPVCNTPDYGTREVADHAIGLLLALTRGIVTYNNRLLASGAEWGPSPLALPAIRRLSGQALGIVGLGPIGMAMAIRASALQMDVGFYDPGLAAGYELALGLKRFTTADELLAASDVVSLHCPLNEATRNLIGPAAVARMRDGAIIINTARSGIVDLNALEQGLRSGRICAAGLDVLPEDRLPSTHPLIAAWLVGEDWLAGRLVVTPHAGFYSPESLVDLRRISTRTTVEFLRHGRLRSCVNLDGLTGHRSRATPL